MQENETPRTTHGVWVGMVMQVADQPGTDTMATIRRTFHDLADSRGWRPNMVEVGATGEPRRVPGRRA